MTSRSEPLTPGALDGIRVLDMSRVLAAPWAAQMLGDLGAEVIKVERPKSGDDARVYGPAWLRDQDGEVTNDSSFFIAANRNKRSITVDFSRPEGREIIRHLAASADVFIENFLAGAMARAGLDYQSLRELNPRLVYCSLTGYGQYGPYAGRPGYDAVFQARSGLMSVTGHSDGEPGGGPMRVGPSIIDITAGYNAAIAILAALLHRDRISGEGQHIDIALLDAGLALQSHAVQGYLISGEVPQRMGTVGNGGHPARVFRCGDEAIYISAGNQRQHEALCRVLGVTELAAQPRFATSPLRFKNWHEWDAVVDPVVARWRAADLQEALVAAGVPCSLIYDYDDLFADEYASARGLSVETAHPHDPDASLKLVANPIRLSETPTRYSRPPRLGEHTDAVLEELAGLDAAQIADLRARGII